MADKDGALDIEEFQQRARVLRQLLETVLVMRGFAGGAKTDLVGNDDAITRLAQRLDAGLPGGAAEILAVHERDGMAVGLTRGGEGHISPVQNFTLPFLRARL